MWLQVVSGRLRVIQVAEADLQQPSESSLETSETASRVALAVSNGRGNLLSSVSNGNRGPGDDTTLQQQSAAQVPWEAADGLNDWPEEASDSASDDVTDVLEGLISQLEQLQPAQGPQQDAADDEMERWVAEQEQTQQPAQGPQYPSGMDEMELLIAELEDIQDK